MMKRLFCLLIVLFMAANMCGCDSFRKKFTRKKKEPVRMPRFYQVKEYKKEPSPELYRKHYAYWMSWQSELVKVLGQNHKKDVRCIEEIVANLRDMQNILVKEKGELLEPHIANLAKVRDVIVKEDLTVANRDYIRRTLEREERSIKREFDYSSVKESLKESFDDNIK